MFFKKKKSRKKSKELVNQILKKEELPLELLFDLIIEIQIGYIGQRRIDVIGLNESEIKSLEKEHNINFPYAFRLFLSKMAAGKLKIFDHQSFNLSSIIETHEVAELITEEDKHAMPDNSYPFSHWQGYQFYYFINDGTSDPPTYLYMEGGDDLNEHPPEITSLGNFSKWLLNLTYSYLDVYADVEGFNVKDAKELLSPLVKDQ